MTTKTTRMLVEKTRSCVGDVDQVEKKFPKHWENGENVIEHDIP